MPRYWTEEPNKSLTTVRNQHNRAVGASVAVLKPASALRLEYRSRPRFVIDFRFQFAADTLDLTFQDGYTVLELFDGMALKRFADLNRL